MSIAMDAARLGLKKINCSTARANQNSAMNSNRARPRLDEVNSDV